MSQYQLAAKPREKKGKEAAKKLRNEKRIPAVFYGPDSEPVMLSIDEAELKKLLRSAAAENIIMKLNIETENGTQGKMVMLKELQSDPIKGKYLHADFYEISMDKEITMNVPVVLINTPVGVNNGGILQHIRREMEISCLPGSVIEQIEVDVSGLDIGESIHIRDITLPEGIALTQEEHLTVAVVNAPVASAKSDDEGDGEEIEGEESEKTEA